ncbi:MAG: hypothetical protein WB682_02955 [Candidatus Dormiibacterota bacterium]
MGKTNKPWLSTGARDGSKRIPITIMARSILIARRRKPEIWRLMKPCITTWPDSVPTEPPTA